MGNAVTRRAPKHLGIERIREIAPSGEKTTAPNCLNKSLVTW
jgi:hypothetical protein